MNFTQLQARAALLASLEGWTDVTPAPAWDVLVNQAWIEFTWDGECIIATTTFPTVANQCKYALTGNWKRLTDVVYDTAGTKSPVFHSSEDYERWARADWQSQASGIPTRYAFAPFNTISLVPPPAAATIVVSVRGVCEGTALALGGDIPPLPDYFHEGIAVKAAMLQGEVYAQGAALTRLQQYQTRYDKFVKDAISYANFEAQGD
jgi:hypothetical protein